LDCYRCGDPRRLEGIHQGKGIADPARYDDCRRANPPDAIKNQRIETATQEQRIQTEQQTKLAEVQRKSAEEARARQIMLIDRLSVYHLSSMSS